MKKAVMVMIGLSLAVSGVAFATGTEVEVGGEGAKGNANPFNSSKAAMRYQTMWKQDEINIGGTIAKIEFKFHSYIGTPPTAFDGYKVMLCHSRRTELSNNYTTNYNFKEPTVVYEGEYEIPAGLAQDDWLTVCNTNGAFNYNNNMGVNLLIEIVWTSAAGADRNLCWISTAGQMGRLRAFNAEAETGTLLANQGNIARLTFGNPAVSPTSLGRVRALYR
ncbi:MAG: hypothetical protein PVH29_14025 [Candidatus Zixiibacteriota bacterium]|jgi:hypothetical protein